MGLFENILIDEYILSSWLALDIPLNIVQIMLYVIQL